MAQDSIDSGGNTTNNDQHLDHDQDGQIHSRPSSSHSLGSAPAVKKPRNAFTELMQPKPIPAVQDKVSKKPKDSNFTMSEPNYVTRHAEKHGFTAAPSPCHPQRGLWQGRAALEQYLIAPEYFPRSRVIWFDREWVLINDLYPKSSVHLLLMPRNIRLFRLHAFEAFKDPVFLKEAHAKVAHAKKLAAEELRRLYGSKSASERPRREAMDQDEIPSDEDLPPGRDWESELKTGIHLHPSMSNLHIHIISKDMCGAKLNSAHHYNTFTTAFLVEMHEFGDGTAENPGLSEEKKVHRYANHSITEQDLWCWRCRKGFGRKWKALEKHLKEERNEWAKI